MTLGVPQHVVVQAAGLAVAQGLVDGALPHRVRRAVGAAVVDQVVLLAADQPLDAVAQQPRRRRVGEGGAARGVQPEHALARSRQQQRGKARDLGQFLGADRHAAFQFGVQGLQGGLGPPHGADVGVGPDPLAYAAVGIPQRHRANLHGHVHAVGAAQAVFEVMGLTDLQHLGPGPQSLFAVLGMDGLHGSLGVQVLLGTLSRKRLPVGLRSMEGPLRVGGEHDLRGGLHQRAEALLAAAQFLAGLALHGHVGKNGGDLLGAVHARRAARNGRDRQPAPLPGGGMVDAHRHVQQRLPGLQRHDGRVGLARKGLAVRVDGPPAWVQRIAPGQLVRAETQDGCRRGVGVQNPGVRILHGHAQSHAVHDVQRDFQRIVRFPEMQQRRPRPGGRDGGQRRGHCAGHGDRQARGFALQCPRNRVQ
ncbi:hypothetical protein DESA109040_13290 [Deinococcus saxicola]